MTEELLRSRWRLFGFLCLAAAVAVAVALWKYRPKPADAFDARAASIAAALPASSLQQIDGGAVPGLPQDEPAVATDQPGNGQMQEAVAKPALRSRQLFHRYTGLDNNYGRLGYLEGEAGQREFSGKLSCDVAYVHGGRGICLVAKRGVVTSYFARLFNAVSLEPDVEFPLAGMPSRARISADGKLAAYTVFLTGHGYTTLDFSTQSVILDASTGKQLLDLETDFAVVRDGTPIKEADFNFWGITFTPDARGFYATLSTNRQHLLVAGDIAARTMTVLYENVECPSLSPDGTRVAYKKRFIENGRIVWQLQVLDLATLTETGLSERRSIDDQLEWLDDEHLLYSVPRPDQDAGGGTDVWVAAADGGSEPRLHLANAYSPSVGG